jgi:hypothetical protein
MTWVEMFTELFKLSVLVVSEISNFKKEQDAKNEVAEVDREKFEATVTASLAKLRAAAEDEAKQAQTAEDALEQEEKKK